MQTKKCAGLTLIEIMISMSILSIALLGISMSYAALSGLNQLTADEGEINNVSREAMARIWAKYKEHDTDNPYNLSSVDYTYIDAMIAFYQQSGNSAFSINGMLSSGSNTANGDVLLYVNENKVPVELGGDIGASNEYLHADSGVYKYGRLDLNSDGLYEDKTVAVDGKYGVNMVPIEIRIALQTRNGEILFRRYMMLTRMSGM